MSRNDKYISLLDRIEKHIGNYLVSIDKKYSKPVSATLFMMPVFIMVGIVYLLVYFVPMLILALLGITLIGIGVLVIQNHHKETQYQLDIKNKDTDLER